MVFVAGLGLMVFPVAVPAIFGGSSEDPDWTCMVGLLAFILSIYYLLAVRARLEPCYP
jgi:hypothetical protein